MMAILKDHSVYAPSQWEMALQCSGLMGWWIVEIIVSTDIELYDELDL